MKVKSIMQDDLEHCFICNCYLTKGNRHLHHVFNAANKKRSEQYGLLVYLCPECHVTGRYSVHQSATKMKEMKQIGQKFYESSYGNRQDFINEFGKSYL